MRGVTILSGGQTGADRAALDFAHRVWPRRTAAGVRAAGWPKMGRSTNATNSPRRRRAVTTSGPTGTSATATRPSCSASMREVSGGTALTLALAERLGKPCLHLSSEAASATGADPAERAPGVSRRAPRRTTECRGAAGVARAARGGVCSQRTRRGARPQRANEYASKVSSLDS